MKVWTEDTYGSIALSEEENLPEVLINRYTTKKPYSGFYRFTKEKDFELQTVFPEIREDFRGERSRSSVDLTASGGQYYNTIL